MSQILMKNFVRATKRCRSSGESSSNQYKASSLASIAVAAAVLAQHSTPPTRNPSMPSGIENEPNTFDF